MSIVPKQRRNNNDKIITSMTTTNNTELLDRHRHLIYESMNQDTVGYPVVRTQRDTRCDNFLVPTSDCSARKNNTSTEGVDVPSILDYHRKWLWKPQIRVRRSNEKWNHNRNRRQTKAMAITERVTTRHPDRFPSRIRPVPIPSRRP